MSFDSRKKLAGQQIVEIGVIQLDQCIHTTKQSVIDGAVTVGVGVDDSYIGTISISGGSATSFASSTPYILWDSEIIEVVVNSDVELDVISRGKFGTLAVSHLSGIAKLMHSGEADGSCYGFPHGCSSGDSYDTSIKKDFVFPSTQLELNQIFFNGFDSWSHSPVKVDPGQSMGKRSGGTLSLIDSVDNDVYVPYKDRRTSNATLFKKILARHPNLGGRPLKILTGFNPLDYDETNFNTREYIIDSVSLKNGKFNVKFLDPLILTEDKKAKAPLASQGVLSAIIDNASTEISYTSAPPFDYGLSGTVYVRVDSELIECTVLSDFVLTIVNRAIGGTEEKDHSINTTVQKDLFYDNVNVVEIIEDLLTNYTVIDSRFIDDYSSVISGTSSITLTAHISKPTEVKTLIDELIKTGDLVVFYSETKQKIVIKKVSDASAGAISINSDDHIERDSISVQYDSKNQFTRYTVAWAPNDVTKIKDEEFFSIVYQSINLPQELDRQKGEVNEKKKFFNRWLTDSNEDVIIGTAISQRVIDRSEEVPEVFTFNLDVESVFNTQNSSMEEGTIFTLATNETVNPDGTAKAKNHQVLSMKDLGNMKYQITSRLFQDPLDGVTVDFTISENKENYDLSVDFSPIAGNYTVLIDTGVVIGSTNTTIPAFTTGIQAPGVTFDFIVRGSILGHGGAGAEGGVLIMPLPVDVAGSFSQVGDVGFVGGNAFNATVNCTINTGSGAVWAGGGGSAGGRSAGTNDVFPIFARAGNGGCGGQGYGVSLGATFGTVSIEPATLLDSGLVGTNGNITSQGILAFSEGGSWGEPGDDDNGVPGGLGGFAIVSNGNNVTISSGDNSINIKGRRS